MTNLSILGDDLHYGGSHGQIQNDLYVGFIEQNNERNFVDWRMGEYESRQYMQFRNIRFMYVWAILKFVLLCMCVFMCKLSSFMVVRQH